MKPYQTLLAENSDEQIIQKSRFIGYAKPVYTEADALQFLATIRQKHKDATHNCYAYIIGQNAGIMRYSDDGEPSGTAGMPIIEVLKAQKVVDAIVVVTRYFGGVLLGAGGLVRAYNSTCALALRAAQVATMHPTQTYLCEVTYPLWDKVRYTLDHLPVRLLCTDFMTSVVFSLQMKEVDEEDVLATLVRITDGTIETLLEDSGFSPWIERTADAPL